VISPVAVTIGFEGSLILLLAVALAVAFLTQRARVPYTIGLVIVGLGLGIAGAFGAIRLSSDLVFYIFLPAIIFQAALETPGDHLRSSWPLVLVLTVPGVMLSFALVALGMHYLLGQTWIVAALFGALISATDPVSVVALFRRFRVDRRLTTIVESESFFNDGTAAVVFAIALAFVTSGSSPGWGSVLGRFFWMALGGLGLGLILGFAATYIHRLMDERLFELTLTVVVAYGSFLLAQWLEMSGPVACAAAGVVVGNFGRQTGMSEGVSQAVGDFWDFAAFIVNSLVFLLIGLSVDLKTELGQAALIAAAFALVVGARAVTVYISAAATRPLIDRVPFAWQHAMVWGGLRGAVALALVLSIPADVTGQGRLVVLAFGVVLGSLLLQGLSMPLLMRKLRLTGPPDSTEDAAHTE
jgi:Na+:H+ antiporter